MPDKTAKPDIFGKKLYSFQLFEETSNFVWPEIGSVALSLRLRATDPFSGQTKLLWSEKPV